MREPGSADCAEPARRGRRRRPIVPAIERHRASRAPKRIALSNDPGHLNSPASDNASGARRASTLPHVQRRPDLIVALGPGPGHDRRGRGHAPQCRPAEFPRRRRGCRQAAVKTSPSRRDSARGFGERRDRRHAPTRENSVRTANASMLTPGAAVAGRGPNRMKNVRRAAVADPGIRRRRAGWQRRSMAIWRARVARSRRRGCRRHRAARRPQYSGPVAAHAYALLRSRRFDVAVLVGPSHFVAFDGVAIHPSGSFRNPTRHRRNRRRGCGAPATEFGRD